MAENIAIFWQIKSNASNKLNFLQGTPLKYTQGFALQQHPPCPTAILLTSKVAYTTYPILQTSQ